MWFGSVELNLELFCTYRDAKELLAPIQVLLHLLQRRKKKYSENECCRVVTRVFSNWALVQPNALHMGNDHAVFQWRQRL